MGSCRQARGIAGVVVTLALTALVACGQILGVQDIQVVPDLDGDAGSGPTTEAGGGGGGDAGGCTAPSDCPVIATTPPDCAEAQCVAGACLYRAKDVDRDGHPMHVCASPGVAIALGDDCDDGDDTLYPGHDRACSATPDGGVIVFPGGTPRGACKAGTQSCNPDGTVSSCVGAVGPTTELCTTAIDEDCDGNGYNGCACVPGDSKPCGSSSAGVCHLGTTTCANNAYGACIGSVEPGPRQCGSGADNDCNGVADNAEAACQCPGGGGPTASRACNGHAQDGIGVCHAGSQTCIAGGASSSWSACTGDVGPSAEGCDGNDYDCNGVAGVNDPAPPEPAGTLNCTHVFRCPAAGRGTLYYRLGVGWTNYAGTNTIWIGYAPQGDFSSNTFPPGEYRISRDAATGTKMGPVSVGSACCPAGCPTGSVLSDGNGQFYTPP